MTLHTKKETEVWAVQMKVRIYLSDDKSIVTETKYDANAFLNHLEYRRFVLAKDDLIINTKQIVKVEVLSK